MNNFSLTELYEISDALVERRKRMLSLQTNPLQRSKTMERMINAAQSAHDKVSAAIIDRITTLP